MAASGQDLTGLAAPWDQVQQALNDLGIQQDSFVKKQQGNTVLAYSGLS